MIAVVSTVVKRCQCNMQHIIFRRYQHRLACCRVPAMQATASSPPSPTLCHVLLLCATFSYCSITFSFAPPELSPTPRRTTFSYSYFSSITFSYSSITSSYCTPSRSHTSRFQLLLHSSAPQHPHLLQLLYNLCHHHFFNFLLFLVTLTNKIFP